MKITKEIIGKPFSEAIYGKGNSKEMFGIQGKKDFLVFGNDGVVWLESEGLDMFNLPEKVRLRIEIEVIK